MDFKVAKLGLSELATPIFIIRQLISNYILIIFKRFVSAFTVKLCNEFFFQLHLIFHAYISKFAMIGTVDFFLKLNMA